MSMLKRSTAEVFAAIALLLVFSYSAQAQSGGMKGKVRDPQGRAIANATVAARQDGKDIKTARTNSKGDFQITGLRPGTYNLAVDADGYSTGVRYGVVVKNSIVNLGNRLTLAADLGALVLVRGSVFFREGTSVTAAKVELFDVAADGRQKSLGTTYTNVSGDFTFRRPEGAATLRVKATYKGTSGTKDIEVETRGIYRTAITLDLSRNDR